MNGLGDLIYYTLRYTGIQFLVKTFNRYVLGKEDCGCQRRRWILNRKYPFRK